MLRQTCQQPVNNLSTFSENVATALEQPEQLQGRWLDRCRAATRPLAGTHCVCTVQHCACTLLHFVRTLLHFVRTLLHFVRTLLHSVEARRGKAAMKASWRCVGDAPEMLLGGASDGFCNPRNGEGKCRIGATANLTNGRTREKFPLRIHYSGSCGAKIGSKIPCLTAILSNETWDFHAIFWGLN